jgi:hypothetical protein
MGLHLSERNGGLRLLFVVGFSCYRRLILSSRISDWEFENPDVLLHRKLNAECHYWLEHSCTQATRGFGFSQRVMTLTTRAIPTRHRPRRQKIRETFADDFREGYSDLSLTYKSRPFLGRLALCGRTQKPL